MSCSQSAPSVEANVRVSRWESMWAEVTAIRGSPRIDSSAASSSASLSSSATANGSSSAALSQRPRAGGSGASGVEGARGWFSATASARSSAASSPPRLRSRVAAKPHAPPTRTRTPTPSDSAPSTSSTAPLRVAIDSVRACT